MSQSLFTKIINREIPAKIAYEDDAYIAIHDIDPKAPVHLLVIPKREIRTLNDLSPDDATLVGGMFVVAKKLMKDLGHSDYRTVFNCGPAAGQSVYHIHLHVLAGRTFFSPSIQALMAELLRGDSTTQARGTSLTDREREVLSWLARGLSSKEVAQRLDISVRTVETHRANLMQKLGVKSVAMLIQVAIREGMLDPPSA